MLLHLTSLPDSGGQGGLGSAARRFVDFLRDCGFSVWQSLPLGPTHADLSPYACLSVNAGNTTLISREDLVERGWLPDADRDREDWLLRTKHAFGKHAGVKEQQAYRTFIRQHAGWLDDYALYTAIRQVHGDAPWYEWPVALRDRDPAALERFRKQHAELADAACFGQYLFFSQWHELRDYARRQGVALFGDIPIYVAHDSADVWANRDQFTIDGNGRLETVSGVPPDYFSATGQRWGNPLFRWNRMEADGFSWWTERFRTQLELFDIIRLDHFRGFEKYWEIPASEATALNGRWVDAPGYALFERLTGEFGELPVVAEDLGTITPEVITMRRHFGFPGMKVLQFAFDSGPDNPYLPQHHERESVVYTGTHDNDTTLGWFESRDKAGRRQVFDYLSGFLDADADPMPWPMIRAALASAACLAVIPLQDVLELGSEHRMNTPGSGTGNWRWQFDWTDIPASLEERLRRMTLRYGRCRV